MPVIKDDGTIQFTKDEARELIAELRLGTQAAGVIGDALDDAVNEEVAEDRCLVIEVLP